MRKISGPFGAVAGVAVLMGMMMAVAIAAQATNGSSSLPVEAQCSISAALGRDLPGYRVRTHDGAVEAVNPKQKLAGIFTAQGLTVHSGRAQWGLMLHGYGYGDHLKTVNGTAPQARANRVEYRRGPLTEWYVNGPLGLEQGFTVSEQPGRAKGQPLTIALALSGDSAATVEQDGKGLTLAAGDAGATLRYSGLAAHDADGKELQSWLEVQGDRLLLNADDTGARYPVVIDPLVQLAKLTASDGSSTDFFGSSVAVGGNTVVVGADYATWGNDKPGPGAAYVFVKPSTGWKDMTETAKLTASDGASNDLFGSSVGISGNAIVVGAPFATFSNNSPGKGKAYVFVRPSGGWANMTQTTELTASDGLYSDGFGGSVSMSGNTVVAGSGHATYGEVYVFVEPAAGWPQNMTQTAELTASDGKPYDEFGDSVSISGNTVAAGAGQDLSGGPGASYVFVKPAGGWRNSTQTAELTASDGVTNDLLGCSVAVSGNTVVAGARNATIGSNSGQGAAYVFVEPAGGWTNMTQTAKLRASDGTAQEYFGYAISISGTVVAVGAPSDTVGSNQEQGAAYVFVEPANGWVNTTQNIKLSPSDGAFHDYFSEAVAVSGKTVVGGAAFANGFQGAAYIFGP